MSITQAVTILILLSGTMQAQLPDAPHKFWNKKQVALFAADAGAKAFDAYQTHQHVSSYIVPEQCMTTATSTNCAFAHPSHWIEGDPIARPFVKRTAGQVGYFSASLAADVGIAYLFHKTGHHKLERATMLFGAAQSSYAASTWIGKPRI